MSSQRKSKGPNMKKILSSNSSSKNRRVKKKISELEEGDYYKGSVKILRKVKPGPLILTVFDGTKSIDAIGHDRIFEVQDSLSNEPKVYNYGNIQIKDNRNQKKSTESETRSQSLSIDEIQVDNIVRIFGKVVVHKNELEIELKSIKASTMDFDDIIRTQSLPLRDTFSITSKRYEDMKSMFTTIAHRIRRAIIEEQPIVIRHHNDTDGICAGLAIEQSIRNVMDRRDLPSKHRIYRSPSVSPFYDEIDLFRDISKYNRYVEEFGDKTPLLLLLDTGSTPENEFALKVLHGFNFECIIIDHHNPGPIENGKSRVCPYLLFHLNPYLFGWDSETCGGMLCYELARFIDEEYHQPLYPAVAAVGDRVDCPEVNLLIENAKLSRDNLKKMAITIDYMAYNFRFDAGDSVYDKVFTNENIVDIIYNEVKEMFDKTLSRILPVVSSIKFSNVFYSEVDLENYTQRGQYPTPGKVLGLIHDNLAQHNNSIPVFTVGYFSDGVIIRATESILPVPSLLVNLQNQFPDANVEGGGHEQAGSIKFIPIYENEIRNFIKSNLENL